MGHGPAVPPTGPRSRSRADRANPVGATEPPITLRVPNVSRAWAEWRTKDIDGLDCRFLGKKGQFNLSRLEGLGATTATVNVRGAGDVVRMVFQHLEPSQAAKLKELLAEHLRGFRETIGQSGKNSTRSVHSS